MHSRQSDISPLKINPAVHNKLKYLTCTNCKQAFSFRGGHQFRGKIPLLLECGHATCEICAKTSANKSCGSCNIDYQQNPNKQTTFLVNLYLLGLMNASQCVAINSAEPNIEFQQSAAARFRKSIPQDLEYCSECGLKADFRCRQCEVFFCNTCYAKIHGRALQNHQKVSLIENASDMSNFLPTKCDSHPFETIQFYCTQCEVSACTHCLLLSHQSHSIISQSEKIKDSKSQIEDTIEKLADVLQRVIQAERKLAKPFALTDLSNGNETEREKIEARLSQHFTYLHGVLQNIENRFITQLYDQKNIVNNNLNAIKEQLKEQRLEIEHAIRLATSVLESGAAVNLAAVNEKLETTLNLPCHLIYNSLSEEKIELDIDESIVNSIEGHCSLKLRETPSYSLARTDELPDDYVIEPIVREEPPKPLTPVIKSQFTLSRTSLSRSMLSLRSTVMDKEKQNGTLVEGTNAAVQITYIKDPSCFYTQLLCALPTLNNLQKSLEKQGATSPIPAELELNKLYIVQYSHDMKWYRARVTALSKDVKGSQICDVFYIDYGNNEISVPIRRVRNLSVQSSRVSIMATKCALYDIVPKFGQWEVDANKAMHDMIDGTTHIQMHVFKIENDIYHVDITRNAAGDGDDTLSIRDALVYMEFGCIVTNERLRKTNPQSLRKFFEEEISIENSYDIRATHIESPDCIFVQKIGDSMLHSIKLTEDMLEEYGRIPTNRGIIYIPQIGMPCAALYDDGKWYRGRISNLLKNQKVEVFFVDFGDKREYVFDEIRRLHYKFMSVTALAFKISLKDVAPLENHEWSLETKKYMVQNLMSKFLKIFIFSKDGDSYKVSLYIPMEDKEVNFNAQLVQERLAISTGSSSQFISVPTRKRKKKMSKAKKSAKLTDDNIYKDEELDNEIEDSDPFRMPVKVLQAVSPDCIYVRDLESAKIVKKLHKEIQEFYNKYTSAESEEWAKDDVCIAYSAKDKSYHRSKIVEIIPPDKVVVFLYDISITETVTTQDLQSLHPKFATLPAQALKVKLAGILPCGGKATWLSSSCEVLSDLINEYQHSRLYISKADGNDNDDISVELWVREIKIEAPLAPTIVEINSVNRKLVKKGVALPIRGYKTESNKVLAVELRQQLLQNDEKNMSIEVEWVVKNEALVVDCPLDATSPILPSSIEISEQDSTTEDENANADADVESDEEFPLPPPLSAWIPPVPITDDKFCAVSTNVDHDCVIYLHSLEQNGDILANIEAALQTHFGGSKPKACDMVWAPKDLCIAQYHADKKWYRAQVLEVLDDDEVKVIFVDYGNVDECKIDTLRKRVIMGHIPIQATKCLVHGLIPDTAGAKWTIPQLDVIHALLVDKKNDVTVLERNPDHLVVSMTLRKFHNMNLVRYLKFELKFNIAEYSPGAQSRDESQDANSEFDSSDNADVVVGECIEDHIPDRVTEPALFNLGFDAKPPSPEGKKTARDCNEEIINTMDLTDNSIPVVDLDAIAELSPSSDYQMITVDNPEYVGSHEEPIDVSSTSENEDDDDILSHYTYIDVPDDVEIVNLEPQHIVDPLQFYARLDSSSKVELLSTYEEQFILMTRSMQSEAYDPPKLRNVRLDSPCSARYTVDDQWYRAIIIDIDHDSDKAKVQYVDYGNTEYLPIDKIHSLPKTWLILPILSFKCRLWGVRVSPDKPSWKMQIAKFEKVFYNGVVTAKIKDRSHGMLDVELYSDNDCTELLYHFLLEDGLLEILKD